MVSSSSHAGPLVVAILLSLTAAQQSQNDLSPGQKPIIDQPTSPLSEIEDARGRDATINLYPPSLDRMRMSSGFDCKYQKYNQIKLATGTCLQGAYYPNNNIKVIEDPVCDDGSVPVLNYYQMSGCKGKTHYTADLENHSLEHSCLWSGYAPEEWSMIFRCGEQRMAAEGADFYQTATPPPAPESLPYFDEKPVMPTKPDRMEEPRDAIVLSHLAPGCTGRRVGGDKPYTLKADKQCATTPGYGIVIRRMAVCSNGTRAKWARYEDEKCGYGSFPSKYGLKDIRDFDIGKCLDTGPINSQTKVRSIAFWCDGLPPQDPNKEPAQKLPTSMSAPGSVSESACMAGKAPFFNHPKTDTCVNFQTSTMKIYNVGTCENGTTPLMAFYEGRDCPGTPASLKPVWLKDLKTCNSYAGYGSFAFWCSGNISIAQTGLKTSAAKPRNEGKFIGFMIGIVIGVAVWCSSIVHW